MSKQTQIGVILILCFNLSSCVVAYKTKDIRKQSQKLNGQFDQNLNQAKAALAQRENLLKQILNSGVNGNLPPYPELKTAIDRTRPSVLNLEKSRAEYQNSLFQLNAAIEGKSKLRSDDPNFKAVETFRNQAEQASQRFQKDGLVFRERLLAVDAIMKRESMGEINLTDLKGKFSSSLEEVREKFKALQKEVLSNSQRYTNEPHLKKTLDQLVQKLEQLDDLNHAFIKEAGNQSTLFIGPQMVSYNLGKKMQGKIQEIDVLFEKVKKDMK